MISRVSEFIMDNWKDIIHSKDKPDALSSILLGRSNKVVILFFSDSDLRPMMCVKVSRDNQSGLKKDNEIIKEHRILKELRSKCSSEFGQTIPEILFFGEFENSSIVIESVASYSPIKRVTSYNSTSHYLKVINNWLYSFYGEIGVRDVLWDNDMINEYVIGNFDRFIDKASCNVAYEGIFEKAELLAFRLKGKKFRIVPAHRDLNPLHVSVVNDHIFVVDWADFENHFIPGYDIFRFIEGCGYLDGSIKRLLELSSSKKGKFRSGRVVDRVVQYFENINLDKSFINLLFILYFVVRVLYLCDKNMLLEAKRVEELFLGFYGKN